MSVRLYGQCAGRFDTIPGTPSLVAVNYSLLTQPHCNSPQPTSTDWPRDWKEECPLQEGGGGHHPPTATAHSQCPFTPLHPPPQNTHPNPFTHTVLTSGS
jgi:hypothetical protein